MHGATDNGQPPVCLWIVHPSRLLRECLVDVLSEAGFQAQGLDPEHDPDEVTALPPPDVVLLYIHLPRAQVVHWLETLKRRFPQGKILLLFHKEADEVLIDYLASSAAGCVSDMASIEELRAAVERVLEGEVFCSPEVIRSVFRRLSELQRGAAAESTPLTVRELEVLRLMAKRLGNKQIARKLGISLYTVKNHVHRILEKLHVEDRHEAVEHARQRRWLPVEACECPGDLSTPSFTAR